MLGSFTEMGQTGQEQLLGEDVCGNEEFCIKLEMVIRHPSGGAT